MKYCECLRNDKGDVCLRLKEIGDEVVELCQARSWEEVKDEVSDVMFGLVVVVDIVGVAVVEVTVAVVVV